MYFWVMSSLLEEKLLQTFDTSEYSNYSRIFFHPYDFMVDVHKYVSLIIIYFLTNFNQIRHFIGQFIKFFSKIHVAYLYLSE